MLKRIMVALDGMNTEQANLFLDRLEGSSPSLKIGMEMFYSAGPEFVKNVQQKYHSDIFLDLKLHDIPNTVKKAIAALEGLPIKFLTIHLAGGAAMLRASVEQARISIPDTSLLGVSYLTSIDQNDFKVLFNYSTQEEIDQAFQRLFELAFETGMDGLILSPKELPLIQEMESKRGASLLKVCPGIRFEEDIKSGETGDQKRVETPESAFSKGADYLVIGRSLTNAKNLSQRLEFLGQITKAPNASD